MSTPLSEAHLDALILELPGIPVPAALAAQTLTKVRFEHEVDRRLPHGPTAEQLDALTTNLPNLVAPADVQQAVLDSVRGWASDSDAAGDGAPMRDAAGAPPPWTREQAANGAPSAAPSDFPPQPLRPRRRRWVSGVWILAAAAALLLVVRPTSSPPDVSTMVERGAGERQPDLALKLAARHGGALGRHATTTEYDVGDELFFRARVDQPTTVLLVRIDSASAKVVHRQALPADEVDLTLRDQPLAWRIEPGEQPAVFALVAAAQPLSDAVVEDALARTYDEHDDSAVCRAAEALGARCASTIVRTLPQGPEQR